ncbi:hypothetical protein N9D80_02245 [Flavobacteriales bacterium]|nr:hypothetical protein [Flavobacteriales bacterium]
MKKILLILISLPIIAFTQSNMTEEERKMRDLIFQLLDEKDSRILLENEGWTTRSIDEFIGEDNNQYFKYSFQKYNSNWDYFAIYDYAPHSYQNIISLSTNQEFYKKFYNLITSSGYQQKDKTIENNTTTTIFSKKEIEILFNEKLHSAHEISIYNTADQEKRKKVLIQKQKQIHDQITRIEEEIKIRILNGENATKFKQYEEALSQFQFISDLLDTIPIEIKDSIDIYLYQNILNDKITQIERLKKEKIIQVHLKEGLDYFYENKYNLALQAYTNVLNLDPYHTNAKNQIKEIKEIIEILKNRKKTHSFKKISSGFYNELINDLEDGLEEIIKESKKGNIRISFIVHFDTLGNNLTTFSINSSENISKKTKSSIMNLLEQNKNDLTDRRTMIKEYYICSKENININLEWSTDNFSVRFTHKEKLPYDISKKVNNYITSVGMYGRYDISQKNKKANYNTNKDILLTDYKIKGGPSNALYSLVIPGLGTKKVNYGEKGSKRIKNFFTWATIGASAKLLSNSFYTDYLNATNQEDMDKQFSNAATYNYIYLGCFTICSTIYITDFFSALSKGIKNKKRSKTLRDKLKNGPIIISNDKIKIE